VCVMSECVNELLQLICIHSIGPITAEVSAISSKHWICCKCTALISHSGNIAHVLIDVCSGVCVCVYVCVCLMPVLLCVCVCVCASGRKTTIIVLFYWIPR